MMRHILALAATVAVLAGCTGIKPEQALMSMCSEFNTLKQLVAYEVNQDARRPKGQNLLEREDLIKIKGTNRQLNAFCPPPAGFAPYRGTLQATRAGLVILTGYANIRSSEQ